MAPDLDGGRTKGGKWAPGLRPVAPDVGASVTSRAVASAEVRRSPPGTAKTVRCRTGRGCVGTWPGLRSAGASRVWPRGRAARRRGDELTILRHRGGRARHGVAPRHFGIQRQSEVTGLKQGKCFGAGGLAAGQRRDGAGEGGGGGWQAAAGAAAHPWRLKRLPGCPNEAAEAAFCGPHARAPEQRAADQQAYKLLVVIAR